MFNLCSKNIYITHKKPEAIIIIIACTTYLALANVKSMGKSQVSLQRYFGIFIQNVPLVYFDYFHLLIQSTFHSTLKQNSNVCIHNKSGTPALFCSDQSSVVIK